MATARIKIDPNTTFGPVNRMVLGQNAEWMQYSHDFLWRDGVLAEELTVQMRACGPASLRFPGGGPGDCYHWADSLGPDRKPQRNPFAEGEQPNPFGPDEFLDTCSAVGAVPWLQSNPVTEPADSPARWAAHCRARGVPALHWELGNEVYLVNPAEPDKQFGLIPRTGDEYVDAASAQLKALRAAEPDAAIGAIGFKRPPFGWYAAAWHQPNWTETVLDRMGADIDFLAVHTAYGPLPADIDWNTTEPDGLRDTFLAVAAGGDSIRDMLRATVEMLDEAVPHKRLGIAVTEWLPWFGVVADSPDLSGSMGGGLYTAGGLHAFLREPRVVAAHFMSFVAMSFGACVGLTPAGIQLSVNGEIFALYGRELGDELIGVTSDAPTFAAPASGTFGAHPDATLIDVLATRAETGVRLFLVNRSLDEPCDVELNADASSATTIAAPHWRSANFALIGQRLCRVDDPIRPRPLPVDGRRVTLPPCSVTVVRF